MLSYHKSLSADFSMEPNGEPDALQAESTDLSEKLEKINEEIKRNWSEVQRNLENFAIYFVLLYITIWIAVYLTQFLNKKLAKNKHAKNQLEKIKAAQEKAEAQKKELDAIFEDMIKRSTKKKGNTYEEPYTEAELKKLLEIIHDNDRAVTAQTPTSSSEPQVSNNNNRKPSYSKMDSTSHDTTSVKATRKDKILKWGDNLPAYNLTQDCPVDPVETVTINISKNKTKTVNVHSIYRLKSNKDFVFINPFLFRYLMENHPQELIILLSICESRNHSISKGKHKTGFAIREEQNALKLNKNINIIDKKEGKKESTSAAESDHTFYIKGKKIQTAPRFYGDGEGKGTGMRLFDIRGVALTHNGHNTSGHKKKESITYFPSLLKMNVKN